jgi:hypothetical protein
LLASAKRGFAVRAERLVDVLDDRRIELGACGAPKLGDRSFLIHDTPVGTGRSSSRRLRRRR